MRCPQCDISMNEVTARANPGSLIQLDQCAQCGGIWCDKWELFPVDPDQASRLDFVDEKLLSTPAEVAKKALYCPRCTSKLAIFNDPILPKDILLQRCRRCEGIWLNRGQLSRYKNYQKKTKLEKMGAEAIVREIPEVYQNPKSWVVTGTRGMFAYPQGVEESQETVRDNLSGAVKLILQSLVRMVLGI
jgi:Zn-finger nucleic acid-binding protein